MRTQAHEIVPAAGTRGEPHVEPAGRVREVAVPPAARALRTLSRVDYEDAFLVQVCRTEDRTAEQWARAMLEDAPETMRRSLRLGWLALGLKLCPAQSDRSVLDWQVRRSTPSFALVGADSRIGMPAELFLERGQHTLLLATFVQHDNPIARAVWAGIEPLHRRVVPYVLEHRGRSIGRGC